MHTLYIYLHYKISVLEVKAVMLAKHSSCIDIICDLDVYA